MIFDRRKFLKAAAVAPAAAKKAAESRARKMADVGAVGEGVGQIATTAPNVEGKSRKEFRKWVLNHGLPEWRREQMREEAKAVHALDPDIASMVSFSLAGKVQMQQQRNYRRAVDNFDYHAQFEERVSLFEKLTGFNRWDF